MVNTSDTRMFNVYIVSIRVFSVRAYLIWSLALLCVPHLRSSFFVSIVNMVKAIKFYQGRIRSIMITTITMTTTEMVMITATAEMMTKMTMTKMTMTMMT